MRLKIATCQFPIDEDVHANERHVVALLAQARRKGADVAHFPETALSGYAGVEFSSFKRYDWAALEAATRRVMAQARKLRLWCLLGSSHRLSDHHKPHNCVYVINPQGRLVDRFDKLFCTGPRTEDAGDLKHYSSGSHFCTFKIKGVTCGVLICHDFRYPELYREYKQRGVQVMFHSYHNGHMAPAQVKKRGNIWGVIVPPTTQAYAASNFMWVSANNTARYVSNWPSFFVRPDGMITGRLRLHETGLLLSTVDTQAKLYDASEAWRDRAMQGVYHSGTLVNDKRSTARRSL